MQSTTTSSVPLFPARRHPAARLLGWLIRANAAYRDAHKLASSPDHRLVDMGISRADADAELRRRFGPRDLRHPTSFGW